MQGGVALLQAEKDKGEGKGWHGKKRCVLLQQPWTADGDVKDGCACCGCTSMGVRAGSSRRHKHTSTRPTQHTHPTQQHLPITGRWAAAAVGEPWS